DRWLSKAQVIHRCKSGHASSLAVWIESKSSRVGGRKIRRGVTIGIKWRMERLRWNCSGLGKTKMVLRVRTTARRQLEIDPYSLNSTLPVRPRGHLKTGVTH